MAAAGRIWQGVSGGWVEYRSLGFRMACARDAARWRGGLSKVSLVLPPLNISVR